MIKRLRQTNEAQKVLKLLKAAQSNIFYTVQSLSVVQVFQQKMNFFCVPLSWYGKLMLWWAFNSISFKWLQLHRRLMNVDDQWCFHSIDFYYHKNSSLKFNYIIFLFNHRISLMATEMSKEMFDEFSQLFLAFDLNWIFIMNLFYRSESTQKLMKAP